MPSFTLKVDNQGRVMLPATWRRRYAIQPSAELVVRERRSGALLVETREQGVRRAQALVRRYARPRAGASVVDEFLAERRAEADREWSE